jgi:hypothetical protein
MLFKNQSKGEALESKQIEFPRNQVPQTVFGTTSQRKTGGMCVKEQSVLPICPSIGWLSQRHSFPLEILTRDDAAFTKQTKCRRLEGGARARSNPTGSLAHFLFQCANMA